MMLQLYVTFLLLPLWPTFSLQNEVDNKVLRYKIITKFKSSFFQDIEEGCVSKALALSEELPTTKVNCTMETPSDPTRSDEFAEIVRSVIDTIGTPEQVSGIAVGVNSEEVAEAVNEVMKANIPVITIDSDSPTSDRILYIGSNNTALGIEQAQALIKLRPEGGNYSIIYSKGLNLIERKDAAMEELRRGRHVWKNVTTFDCEDDPIKALGHIDWCGENLCDAVISVGGWPMENSTEWKRVVSKYPDLTTIISDGTQNQLNVFREGLVDVLVAQQPFVMGERAVQILYNNTLNGFTEEENITLTHLLEHIKIPTMLPPLDLEKKNVGSLVFIGYTAVIIIYSLSLFFSFWIYKNRALPVVRASQPIFLGMICFGTIAMVSSIIPLGMGDTSTSDDGANKACMTVPWLISIGSATIFSALYSKLRRINRIFDNSNKFRRVKVTEKDVMIYFFTFVTLNVIVLILWTIFAPVRFERKYGAGIDPWNRSTSVYGTCHVHRDGIPFLAVSLVLFFFVLLMAAYESYKARKIETEYQESRYITAIVTSLLQTCLIGVPSIAIVEEQPNIYYLLITLLVFLACLQILLFMFIPKVKALAKWKIAKKEKDARKARILEKKDENHPTSNLNQTHYKTSNNHHDTRDRPKLSRMMNSMKGAFSQRKDITIDSLNSLDSGRNGQGLMIRRAVSSKNWSDDENSDKTCENIEKEDKVGKDTYMNSGDNVRKLDENEVVKNRTTDKIFEKCDIKNVVEVETDVVRGHNVGKVGDTDEKNKSEIDEEAQEK